MGYCKDCGAPCPECVRRTDFTLLRLEEPLRKKVKRLLDDVGCRTNSRTNEFISQLMQYTPTEVDRAFRIWNKGGYAFEEKDERYFLGILKHNAVTTKPMLDSLPPVAPYPEEDYREQKDGHEVSSGVDSQPEAKQELPTADGSTEKTGRFDCDCGGSSGTGIDGSGQPDDTGGTGA